VVKPKCRFMFHLSPDIADLLRKTPSGKMTEVVESALSLYFNGDMTRIEQQYKYALDAQDRAHAECIIWKERYDRARAEEDEKVLVLLKEIGFSRTKKPSIPANELEEVYPYLLRHGIKRTKRQIMEIVEGIE